MSSNQGKGGSILYGISINNKGKLVWTESYQLLQTFVEEVLSLSNGVWSCPGGDAKQYKAEDIDIRWYPETQSITLNGKAKDEIKEKLLSVAAIQVQLASTVNEDFDQNGHVDETITHSSQKDNSTLSLETLSSQLEAISKDVNANATAIKLFTEHANAHNTEMDNLKMENHKLLNENIDLKSENNDLKERVNNLSYTLADLQGKAKIAEDEKDSLITAMRLLIEDSNHNDLNHKESVINANHNEEMVQRCPQTANRLQQTNEVPNEVINPSINLSNGFSALSVDENDVSDRNARDAVRNEVECTYANTHRSTQTPNRKQNQSQRKNSTQHRDNQTKQRTDHRNRPNVVIVGDSMIKHIEPAKLRQGLKSGVTFRTFAGAKTEDMKYYLQPTLKAKPSHLILHVGTNDLSGKSPEEIAQNISELGKAATEQVPGLKLSISEIITRSDREDNDQKVQQVNTLVESTCYLQSWEFVKHSNINKSHLNQGGLHLNRRGTAVLAQNFKHCIRTSETN
jgi:outer membrane murein-binding lipoprotein Lpp